MERSDKLNLAQRRWTRNQKESRNPTKEVKFAVEAIEMDETVKNRFKDARIERAKNKLKDARIARAKNKLKDARIARAKNKLKDARIEKIKNESKVEKLQWMHYYGLISANCRTVGSVEDGQLWNWKGSLKPLDAIVNGNRSASEGLKSRAN